MWQRRHVIDIVLQCILESEQQGKQEVANVLYVGSERLYWNCTLKVSIYLYMEWIRQWQHDVQNFSEESFVLSRLTRVRKTWM